MLALGDKFPAIETILKLGLKLNINQCVSIGLF